MLPIQTYVEQNQIKLTQDEINELFKNKEDNESIIIQSQLPLALNLSTSFSLTTSGELEDLFSYALEALKQAYNTYQIDGAGSFTTYASKCINNILKDYRIYTSGVIKQPSTNITKLFAKAYTFASFKHSNDYEDEPFQNIPEIDDTRIQDEDALIKLIQDTLKPGYADIIIKFYGLGLDKPLTCCDQAKIDGTTHQNINLKLNKGLNKLRKNDKFKTLLKRMYNV
jgi:RNA polymerase sigma factor (sigma-70 family)